VADTRGGSPCPPPSEPPLGTQSSTNGTRCLLHTRARCTNAHAHRNCGTHPHTHAPRREQVLDSGSLHHFPLSNECYCWRSVRSGLSQGQEAATRRGAPRLKGARLPQRTACLDLKHDGSCSSVRRLPVMVVVIVPSIFLHICTCAAQTAPAISSSSSHPDAARSRSKGHSRGCFGSGCSERSTAQKQARRGPTGSGQASFLSAAPPFGINPLRTCRTLGHDKPLSPHDLAGCQAKPCCATRSQWTRHAPWAKHRLWLDNQCECGRGSCALLEPPNVWQTCGFCALPERTQPLADSPRRHMALKRPSLRIASRPAHPSVCTQNEMHGTKTYRPLWMRAGCACARAWRTGAGHARARQAHTRLSNMRILQRQ